LQTARNICLDGVRLFRADAVTGVVTDTATAPKPDGLSHTLDGFTGIFNVATLPGFRGRGFGTAVTVRAVADGLAAGSSWCWLYEASAQSSSGGGGGTIISTTIRMS
jgi:ribosomal protein S18 acetylase RimI-like enzyme